MSQVPGKSKLSRFTQEVHLKKSDAEYGKPQEGTQTAARGRKAHQAISGEIVELCQVIEANARIPGSDENCKGIMFGDLFNIYNSISNKVVGLLLRARKYKLVQFEGETLFQGRDNKTPVFLIRSIKEVKEVFKSGEDPASFQWGVIGRQLDEPQDTK
eukprot:GFUD01013264.1.p1 GENE.GFUD01013264.1~~GFUD01013264.1.p1  ORF type:complete len:158 (+),score=35.57 GFUD01013264.1:137-610(+)